MTPYRFREGSGPLVVAMPHVGTALAPEVAETLSAEGLKVGDTDWGIPALYGFLDNLGVPLLQAVYSRTVVDLNRPPDNAPLYPGRFETGLTPTTTFDGERLYREGREPDEAEVARRLEAYWRPYHQKLRETLDATREKHGYAVLLDAHSIRAEIPALFAGRLPDINVGTADGASAAPEIAEALQAELAAQDRFTWVIDGRFKGGWTTRNYGRPAENIHAVQFELVQAAYIDEANPSAFDPAFAAPLAGLIEKLVRRLRDFRP